MEGMEWMEEMDERDHLVNGMEGRKWSLLACRATSWVCRLSGSSERPGRRGTGKLHDSDDGSLTRRSQAAQTACPSSRRA